MVTGDVVNLSNAAVGAFSDKNVGTGKTVTTAMTLTGTDAGNYTLIQPTLAADITPKELTVVGATAADKVYDGTTGAKISGATLSGVVTGDVVSLSNAAVGAFSDKNVGTGKAVTAAMTLSDADAGNYTLLEPMLSASVTPKPIVVAADAKEKSYGDADPELTWQVADEPLIDGDSLRGSLARQPGERVGGYEIELGTLGNPNYTITFVADKLTVMPKELTVKVTIRNKRYNGKNAAAISGYGELVGVLEGDDVSLDTTGANAVFSNAKVGSGKTVTVDGLALTGADADQYIIGVQTATASITASVTGNSGANIKVGNQTIDAGNVIISSKEGGKTKTTVDLTDDATRKALADIGQNGTLDIAVGTGADIVAVELDGQAVKEMQGKQAGIVVSTGSGRYTLPAELIKIDEIASRFGAGVSPKDIKVEITIAESDQDKIDSLKAAAEEGGFDIMVPPVDFSVSCTYDGKTVEIGGYDTYVERMIRIPNGVDATKITTAVVIGPNGTTHHVPTKITVVDGKYYAVVNSLTNGTYALIWNPVAFADVETHWARLPVNDMASRTVVNGVDNNDYWPDLAVTRAEFVADVVRALGLDTGMGSCGFADVMPTDWCYGYLQTAVGYGIVIDCEDGNFNPDDTITREEAMVMIAKAMKLTGLAPELSDAERTSQLSKIADASDISDGARESIAACLEAGIISVETDGTIAPKAFLTRAEAASLLQKLLQESGMI